MNMNTQHRSCIFTSMLYCRPLSTKSGRDKKKQAEIRIMISIMSEEKFKGCSGGVLTLS